MIGFLLALRLPPHTSTARTRYAVSFVSIILVNSWSFETFAHIFQMNMHWSKTYSCLQRWNWSILNSPRYKMIIYTCSKNTGSNFTETRDKMLKWVYTLYFITNLHSVWPYGAGPSRGDYRLMGWQIDCHWPQLDTAYPVLTSYLVITSWI